MDSDSSFAQGSEEKPNYLNYYKIIMHVSNYQLLGFFPLSQKNLGWIRSPFLL